MANGNDVYDWIDVTEKRPKDYTTVEVLCDGGRFAGKWAQTADYVYGRFYDIGTETFLDREIYAWRPIKGEESDTEYNR